MRKWKRNHPVNGEFDKEAFLKTVFGMSLMLLIEHFADYIEGDKALRQLNAEDETYMRALIVSSAKFDVYQEALEHTYGVTLSRESVIQRRLIIDP